MLSSLKIAKYFVLPEELNSGAVQIQARLIIFGRFGLVGVVEGGWGRLNVLVRNLLQRNHLVSLLEHRGKILKNKNKISKNVCF